MDFHIHVPVSIRSPHRSKGRRSFYNALLLMGIVSIRSPHRSKGRLAVSATDPAAALVSIRSPHRSKGRHVAPKRVVMSLALFQSAPLTEARGDMAIRSRPLRRLGVSIRSPHRSKGRRKMATNRTRVPICFNPLPSPKQGETRESELVGPGH